MEKLKFTIRFIVMLAAIPVIMFSELTRKDKGNSEVKHELEKVSVETNKNSNMLSYTSYFLQAVYI
jgi:chemotaxis response regulator CheB